MILQVVSFKDLALKYPITRMMLPTNPLLTKREIGILFSIIIPKRKFTRTPIVNKKYNLSLALNCGEKIIIEKIQYKTKKELGIINVVGKKSSVA